MFNAYLHLILWISCVVSQNFEGKLYNDLLRNYNSLVRPVENQTSVIGVSLGIDLQQIIDIDEKHQLMQANVWLKMDWSDEFLRWDPESYGGLAEVRLPPNKIWRPDILLYNSGDSVFDTTFHTNVLVHSNGFVNWLPPGVVQSTCKIDITWFPFDDQRCSMKFGSWTFSGKYINLTGLTNFSQKGEVSTSTFVANGEWILMGIPTKRNIIKYDCCPEPYYDVTFTLWLRRRTLYYGFNIVIPCVLISSLTVLVFTLPPASGEKLTLGVTIFMSLFVFLLMVAEAIPPTSDSLPLIGTYFSCVMIVVSISLVFTVLVLNLHHRTSETHNMHPWVKSVLLNWLPWFLRIKRPGYNFERKKKVSTSKQNGKESTNSTTVELESKLFEAVENKISTITCCYNGNGVCAGYLGFVKDILVELEFITAHMKKESSASETADDWKFAAMCVDRLCLIIFSSFLAVSTCCILFAAPHGFV